MEKFDVVIIGGGPIGLACGIECKQASLGYVILEKNADATGVKREIHFECRK
jgi:thioredoxin reductase (NADPH)